MILRLFVAKDRDLSGTVLQNPEHLTVVVADSEEFAKAFAASKRALDAGKRPKRRIGLRTHVVRAGENLSRIAKRYRTTAQDIARLNRIEPNRVRVGQVLKIRRGRK